MIKWKNRETEAVIFLCSMLVIRIRNRLVYFNQELLG